jgi:hypothetical protein
MNEAEIITEQVILNILATLTELKECIKQENNEWLANELKAKRELLVHELRELSR